MQHPAITVLGIGAAGLAVAGAIAPAVTPVTGPTGDGLGIIFSVLGKSPEMMAIVVIVLLFLRDRKASVEANAKLVVALESLTDATAKKSAELEALTAVTTAIRRDFKAYRARRKHDEDEAEGVEGPA